MSFSRNHLALLSLLLLALFVRGSVLWAMRDNLQQDPDAYREIAENLLKYGEFAVGKSESKEQIRPTAYRPPLYPVVLSNLPATGGRQLSLVKVGALHLVLGICTVWLTWLSARRYVPDGFFAPLLAGFLIACDPILLNQQSLVMTETLAAFLTILSLWCLARFDSHRSWFNAALAGGSIALAILCRPTFLPWLGLVGAVMVLVRGRNSEFRIQNSELMSRRRLTLEDAGWRVTNLLALGLTAAAVLSPWAMRNYQELGTPIVTTTHGGYTFYLGNNESFYRYRARDKSGLPWQMDHDIPGSDYGTDPSHPSWEIFEDKDHYQRAWSAIRKSPAAFRSACLYRLRQLWSPLPHKLVADESLSRRVLRYATCAWYCGVYVLVAIGIWKLRRRFVQPPWIWGLLLCLTFTAIHTFYWTNLRMRAPLMPFVVMVAAAAITSRRSVSSSAATSSYSPHPPS